MTDSKTWWDSVKVDKTKVNQWLVKQYRGEVTAAGRIETLRDNYPTTDKQYKTLTIIAGQERQHANWVLALLEARGITPDVAHAEDRYWKKTLPGIKDFATGTAVAAHAEKMRLSRIKVISEETAAPKDIVDVFNKILHDEIFHEKAFRSMSNWWALENTKHNQKLGEEVLGLVN